MLPALDRFEVVVPRGVAWRRGVAGLAGAMLVCVGSWLGWLFLITLVFGLGVLPATAFVVLAVLGSLAGLVPALLLFVGLSLVLRDGEEVVKADRRGVYFHGDFVPWEGLEEVRADGDVVAVMLADGSWEDLASELPMAASWWLAATLANLREQALVGPIDDDGLEAVGAARAADAEARSARKAKESVSWKAALPWAPSP